MKKLAPIALFIFDRPSHLHQTLSSLLECEGIDDTHIVVFADGPKYRKQQVDVEAARSVARELLGDRAEYCLSDINKGLSASVINGVDKLLEQYGRVIVLEDDFIIAPKFLTFMNSALDKYCDDKQVYQISGHNFNVPEFAERNSGLFLPMITTWGWATWQHSWDCFDDKAKGWEKLSYDHLLRKRFNLGGAYDYTSMLQEQMQGKRDSWGIRWWWTVFNRKGLTLFPPQTLIRNTGMDGTGTHGAGFLRNFSTYKDAFPKTSFNLPLHVEVKPNDIVAVQKAIWSQNGGWLGYFADQLKKSIRKFRW